MLRGGDNWYIASTVKGSTLIPSLDTIILVNDQLSLKRCTYEGLNELDNDGTFRTLISNDKDDALSNESEQWDHPNIMKD